MRHYQKTGYKWLKVLDNYKFGGILADDMGLGKTVQMLSIVAGYVEQESQRTELISSLLREEMTSNLSLYCS